MDEINSATGRIISNWLYGKLLEWDIPESVAIYLNLLALLLALTLIVIVTAYITRKILEEVLTKVAARSEEHTSELQSLMRISYAVFCLKKKNKHIADHHRSTQTTT